MEVGLFTFDYIGSLEWAKHVTWSTLVVWVVTHDQGACGFEAQRQNLIENCSNLKEKEDANWVMPLKPEF